MILLSLYLILAICGSFLCSLLEAVILSITPAYIEASKQKGNSIFRRLEKMKSNIDRPLAAILSLNRVAGLQIFDEFDATCGGPQPVSA